ncbi:MAG TPA: hypothetical protein VEA92_02270 [Candidatus Paceibacterota bacterium]|nr:hypothetical protein [Candidatus Paceibacterota bacterium]
MKKRLPILIVLLLLIGVPMGYWAWYMTQPGKHDSFATCLKDSGALFYGAFWCPHCQQQKAMFGKSEKLLPYVECSQPSGQGQLQVCTDAGITGYPTWVFPDGTRLDGTQSLEALSQKTSCELPA